MIAYDRLSAIIPPGIALANKALSVSLGQVSGIPNMTLATFAKAVKATTATSAMPQLGNAGDCGGSASGTLVERDRSNIISPPILTATVKLSSFPLAAAARNDSMAASGDADFEDAST